jgi:hypothetical protein
MVEKPFEKKQTREDLVQLSLSSDERSATGDLLSGINSICGFVGQSAVTLMAWRRDYGFPMQRPGDESIWCSTKSTIREWFMSRGLSPENASEGALHRFWEKDRERRGIKRFRRLLIGISEIAAFAKTNELAIQEWMRDRDGCPIGKTKNGTLHADADEIVWWCRDQGLRNEFYVYAGRPLPSPVEERNDG